MYFMMLLTMMAGTRGGPERYDRAYAFALLFDFGDPFALLLSSMESSFRASLISG